MLKRSLAEFLHLEHNRLINIPVCLRVAVEDIINVLVTPTLYILGIGTIVAIVGRSFVIVVVVHVDCFLMFRTIRRPVLVSFP